MSYKLVDMIGYGSLVDLPNLVRIGSKMASPGGGEVWPNQGLAYLFFFFLFLGIAPWSHPWADLDV
jgi:hypothetical protein